MEHLALTVSKLTTFSYISVKMLHLLYYEHQCHGLITNRTTAIEADHGIGIHNKTNAVF